MRPINKKSFGPQAGKIAIKFHNGTAVVTGHIVKQLGHKTFIASVNGVDTFKVTLAQTTALASALTAGYATIEVTPFGGAVEHLQSIHSRKLVTTEGRSYAWSVAPASVAGQAGLATVIALLAISGTPGAAKVGVAYSFTPVVTGGSGTKTFALTGTLPGGLTFATSTGKISGTPTAAGTTSGLSIKVTDSSGNATLSNLSIVVAA